MAVPKKKTSYQKSRSRRMVNMKLKPVNFYLDEAGNPCLPHRIDSNGMYKGRKVFSETKKTLEDSSSGSYENDAPSAIDHFPV